jgi:dolichol-phosphate mannosyltransferase
MLYQRISALDPPALGAIPGWRVGVMSLEQNLAAMERAREKYWLRYAGTSPTKLRWRALVVRHCFHVLPGESILELGAGSGLWTRLLGEVLGGENPITAAVFNPDLIPKETPPNVSFVAVRDVLHDLPAESFDYVIGTVILCHNQYEQNLRAIYRLLKPGGQLLFFEANALNPQVAVKIAVPAIGRISGHAACQIGLTKYRLMKTVSRQGFTEIDVVPYDIIHPRTPKFLVRRLQSLAFIAEHAPIVNELCGTLYIWARKPGGGTRPRVDLGTRAELFGSTSVVVPCHNEEMNIPGLVESLLGFYGRYIHEIIIINDNSNDNTSAVARRVAAAEPRVKVIDRKPPNGVGRALRDGYRLATGRYILTMDCDFVAILPEFKDLFEAIASGKDGAIGSRFSYESVMINYPFFKILCNRAFHWIAGVVLPNKFRDISNNLKIYRADILKEIVIEQNHFAANVETGLKPLLAGYDIEEVPISWINRTVDMGSSSFRIAKVAPGYFRAFLSMAFETRLARGKGIEGARRRYGQLASAMREESPSIACPICGRDKLYTYLDAPTAKMDEKVMGSSRHSVAAGTVLRCRTCEFGFQQQRLSGKELSHLYRRMDTSAYKAEFDGRRRTAKRHFQIVSNYVPSGRLLDVGSASGLFLTEAANAGWDVFGVEPSEDLCIVARESLSGRGEIQCTTLEDSTLRLPFDVVTLWDVLEHVPDPIRFLTLCRGLLDKSGYLFLNVPDLDSKEAKLLGSRWPLLLPEHLNYFNRSSLVRCGEQAGLKLVQFGRRKVWFSLRYIQGRLSQHRLVGMNLLRTVANTRLGQVVVPISLGETYAVWRRQA